MALFQYMKHDIFKMSPLNNLRTTFVFYSIKTLFFLKTPSLYSSDEYIDTVAYFRYFFH